MNISPCERYPFLRAAATKLERFDSAIESIMAGKTAGSIRNSILNDAKSVISNAVNKAWKIHVSYPLFDGRWGEQSKEIIDLYHTLTVYGLHDVIAASKKIAKSKATGAAVDAMKGFIAEVLPLALAVADLKNKVVKGRAPNSTPKTLNPNKIIKTCPVCFRPIAVKNKLMAHHGYERPGYGWQTPSCPGTRFEPLEVSSAGLEWLISTLREQLQRVEALLANRFTIERLQTRDEEWVTKDSPDWGKHFGAFVAGQELEAKRLTGDLLLLDKKLEEWTPETK